jgi:hydrogenase expression/formation protein HypE
MEVQSSLKSDCASLYPVVKTLIDKKIKITALRDATRGGVSAVLNEWARQSDICIEIQEQKIPISNEVQGVCELFGFDALSLANEGTFCLAVPKKMAKKALKILQHFNKNASIIGTATHTYKQKVILRSDYGTKRFLDMPSGEILPRIC